MCRIVTLGLFCLTSFAAAAQVDAQDQQRVCDELAAVRSEVAELSRRPTRTRLANSGFEASSDQIDGWTHSAGAGISVQIDQDRRRTGTRSIRLQSQGQTDVAGPIVSLRSERFTAPPTRRLAITAWMWADPTAPQPAVWLLFEGQYQGRPFEHHVAVGSAEGASDERRLDDEWTPVTIEIDDLPTEGLSDVRVGIDLRSAGEIWVDDVELADMWLTDQEHRQLLAALDGAQANAEAGRVHEVERFFEATLPNMLSQYADPKYLAPSLAKIQEKAASRQEGLQDRTVDTVLVAADAGQAVPGRKTPRRDIPSRIIETSNFDEDGAFEVPPPVVGHRYSALPMEQPPSDRGQLPPKPIGAVALPADGQIAGASAAALAPPVEERRPWWQFWRSNKADAASPIAASTTNWSQQSFRTAPRTGKPSGRPGATQESFSIPKSAFGSWFGKSEPGAQVTGAPAPMSNTAEPPTQRRWRIPFLGANEAEHTQIEPLEAVANSSSTNRGPVAITEAQSASYGEYAARESTGGLLGFLTNRRSSSDDGARHDATATTAQPSNSRGFSFFGFGRRESETPSESATEVTPVIVAQPPKIPAAAEPDTDAPPEQDGGINKFFDYLQAKSPKLPSMRR